MGTETTDFIPTGIFLDQLIPTSEASKDEATINQSCPRVLCGDVPASSLLSLGVTNNTTRENRDHIRRLLRAQVSGDDSGDDHVQPGLSFTDRGH